MSVSSGLAFEKVAAIKVVRVNKLISFQVVSLLEGIVESKYLRLFI